ncbi:type ISP restriction/modification enzyme [Glutamicibacter sp. NPDC090743]|uniref:type ISP restriction/modification enzyme n=1 Tax=Glutamicibacter sp. NPDC090743 TaxID=3364001 RepID=UPI003819494C
MSNFDDAVAAFGSAARENLSGPGEREALLSRPVGNFIERVGYLRGLHVVAHDEVSEQDGAVRPDFGIRVNSVLSGHVELKAPGVSLDPDDYSLNSHNGKQWARLSKLPNLLHTNGKEWRLWRFGELAYEPVHVHAPSIASFKGDLTAPSRLELLLHDFLSWEPAPITSINKLVDTIAPLSVMLREEVKLALAAERRAIRSGAPRAEQPFLGVAKDWRRLLFPNADDEKFADGFAQTVVFSLVLALSDGISLKGNPLSQIAKDLEGHYGVLGRSLDLLTEHIDNTPTLSAIEIITRTLSGARWDSISASGKDVYLHLYENFLSSYDPEKRKESGSYYTPSEIVDFMVRISDDAVKDYLKKDAGLRDPSVSIIDPAMGTGTYPLSILRHVGNAAGEQYGPGAASEAVASVASRIYGIELQSGPFSVAELRISQAVKNFGTQLNPNALNLYVADTLEDPHSASESQLSYTLQMIAQQRIKANLIKREKNIQVVIGNPPYKEKSKGLGGWIENGVDPKTGKAPLEEFMAERNANHNQHLRNLYAYFWRWATHKVFESTAEPDIRDGDSGVICFITAAGYLTSPGYKKMREYMRRKCSHGWIFNVSPEGLRPPAKNAVFNIGTPVVIGMFVRGNNVNEEVPAQILYRDVHGTREQKYKQLSSMALDDDGWSHVRSGWSETFTPSVNTVWDDYPAVGQLFSWAGPGVKANRKWVFSPSPDVLEQRLRDLVAESDAHLKIQKFQESFHAKIDKTKKPLPGTDTEKNTHVPFEDVDWIENPKIVRVGYRSFDRQYLVADSRLIHSPSALWDGRVEGQIFAVEQHVHYPKAGPGLMFSSLIPDMDYFNNRGGRAIPLLHPDGSPNIAPGLERALKELISPMVSSSDLFFYVAGLTGNAAYLRKYDEELHTPGVRIPLTGNLALWDRAVEHGKHLVWLHTFGASGQHPNAQKSILEKEPGVSFPVYAKSVNHMPTEVGYDSERQVLNIGGGEWENVSPEVRNFTVGGMNVIDSWVGYRQEIPKGRKTEKSSALEGFVQTQWPGEWSIELTEILVSVTRLVALDPYLEALLEDVEAGELITHHQLAEAGAQWPMTQRDRKPRVPMTSEFFED